MWLSNNFEQVERDLFEREQAIYARECRIYDKEKYWDTQGSKTYHHNNLCFPTIIIIMATLKYLVYTVKLFLLLLVLYLVHNIQ